MTSSSSFSSTAAERPVMYLEHDDWSPRYQDTFYTVRQEHFELFTSPPAEAASCLPPNHLGGKTNFPAYYYKIEVFCGRHPSKTIFRRYSQFKRLYEKMSKHSIASDTNTNTNSDLKSLSFPPGTVCFCSPQTESFARNRSVDLRDFLAEALTRRDVASHEVVSRFLELDSFASTKAMEK